MRSTIGETMHNQSSLPLSRSSFHVDKKRRQTFEETDGVHRTIKELHDPKDLELWYFADADLAGDPEDTKSTSGGRLVVIGPGTWFPICWVHQKQTATRRSTLEAEDKLPSMK